MPRLLLLFVGLLWSCSTAPQPQPSLAMAQWKEANAEGDCADSAEDQCLTPVCAGAT